MNHTKLNHQKTTPTQKQLIQFIVTQSAFLLLALVGPFIWPDRALAFTPFTFMGLGISVMLMLGAYEKRIGILEQLPANEVGGGK